MFVDKKLENPTTTQQIYDTIR